jgi:hypothetical protein
VYGSKFLKWDLSGFASTQFHYRIIDYAMVDKQRQLNRDAAIDWAFIVQGSDRGDDELSRPREVQISERRSFLQDRLASQVSGWRSAYSTAPVWEIAFHRSCEATGP